MFRDLEFFPRKVELAKQILLGRLLTCPLAKDKNDKEQYIFFRIKNTCFLHVPRKTICFCLDIFTYHNIKQNSQI